METMETKFIGSRWKKFMIKTSLHKEKLSRSRISRKGKFCALRFQRCIFWWFFDDCYDLKHWPPPREFCVHRFRTCPSRGSQSDQCSSRAEIMTVTKWQNLGFDIGNDNNKQPWLWYRKWKNLKVLDGLLPVPSEAVDYTGGKTIHKPGIVNVKFLTKIVIFIWLRL